MDCPADLLLVFVLDKNASETARSKTDSRQLSPFSMLLLAVPDAVSSHKKTSSKSALQSIFCVIPHCPRGSLIPYKSEENQFHPVLASIEPCAPMLLQRVQDYHREAGPLTGRRCLSQGVWAYHRVVAACNAKPLGLVACGADPGYTNHQKPYCTAKILKEGSLFLFTKTL